MKGGNKDEIMIRTVSGTELGPASGSFLPLAPHPPNKIYIKENNLIYTLVS